MMNIILFVVMIITLMGAATYGLVGAMRNLQTGIEGLLVQDRLEEAAQAVVANIVSVTTNTSQIYYVPAPDNLSTPTVPTWVTPNAQTPRGVKFLYCPFSNNASGTSGSGNLTTPSSSYNVTIGTAYSGTYTNSYNYVYHSTTRPSNQPYALAILVAPGPGQSALSSTQDCLNVSTTGTIAGATVRVITEQEVQSRAQVIASYGNEFYAAASASGDGKGTSTSNSATFSTVMDYVNKFRPQRVTVDLHPHQNGFISGDMTAANADMDQTTVTTRQFTAVRNHSIYYNGYSLSGSSGNAHIFPSASGTFSPVVLGNAGFKNIYFSPSNSQLLRPVADSFGNVIMSSGDTMYAAAENLGRVVNASNTNKIPIPASSPTGGEMYYTQNGGAFIVSAELQGFLDAAPAISSTGYMIYNDFGGTTAGYNAGYINLLFATGSVPPVFVSGGGSLTGTLYMLSNNSFPYLLEDDLGSRSYASIQSNAIPAVYNQGGLFSGSISIISSPSYAALAGPGSNFNLNIASSSNSRPSTAAIHSNSANGQYGAATLAGSGSILGSNSGTTQCLSDTASYNLGSDTNNVTGGSLAPRGNIGREASIMTNHSTGTCN